MTDQSIQRFSYHFNDIDLLTEAMAKWDVQFLPLSPANNNHSINILFSQDLIVQQFFIGQRVHQQGATPEGFITFGLPSNLPGKMTFNNHPLNRSIVVFAGGKEYSSVSPAAFAGNSISIKKATLAKLAEQYDINIDIENLDRSEMVLPVSEEDSDHFRQLLNFCFNEPAVNQKIREDFLRLKLSLKLLTLIASGNREPQKNTRASYNALTRARRYIDTNAFRPIKVTDICNACHTQERTLERAFKDYFKLTPNQYLRQVRLHHAHQALKSNRGAENISAIAARCGFSHPGRFASYYRQQYNESPSDTLDNYT